MPANCGTSAEPAASALAPSTCWTYSGMSTIEPNSEALSRNSVAVAPVNEGRVKRRTSMSGSSLRSACTTNAASNTAPIPSATTAPRDRP